MDNNIILMSNPFTPLYFVNRNNKTNTYEKKMCDPGHNFERFHRQFSENTLYGVGTLLLLEEVLSGGSIVNKQYRINQQICRNADIMWPDEILIDPQDVDKLQGIVITIGGVNIFEINPDFLYKICGSRIRILLPKNLFMNKHRYANYPDPEDDFIGFPMIALNHHEVRIQITAVSKINVFLLYRVIYLNTWLRRYVANQDHNFSINKITKINAINANISIIKISPKNINDMVNSGEMYRYLKNLKRKRELMIEFSQYMPLIIDLNNIIIAYDDLDIDKDEHNKKLYFEFDDDTKCIHSIHLSTINIRDGMLHSFVI
jgi:hypothetical protein